MTTRFALINAAFLILFNSCNEAKPKTPQVAVISIENLQRGEIALCGPEKKQFGKVDFSASCSENTKDTFNIATALLHSFEYDDAEKMYVKVIDEQPDCAMAYWGVAMCNYHPLWGPSNKEELEKGLKASEIAASLKTKTQLEKEYINAIHLYFKDWQTKDHSTRAKLYEKAMERLYLEYPDDIEAAIFYSLALNGTADPTDKTYSQQRKAGAILEKLFIDNPDHPGIIHYIIHNYDYPQLAAKALPAARKYATVAPSSPHALHMPSHIFIRLGLWNESIQSNLLSVEAAKCYAINIGIKGNWDKELHGIDYLVYAYLQLGQIKKAADLVDYVSSMANIFPSNFSSAYAFAAIPCRYLLESRSWEDAASFAIPRQPINYDQFPLEKAIMHYTRALGAIHTQKFKSAKIDLDTLKSLKWRLDSLKDDYKASQVEVQVKTVEGWLHFFEGNKNEAIKQMTIAADIEDNTEKHPVTPGEVLPAREQLGDMLTEMGKYSEALVAYELNLNKNPNRLNGLAGAFRAAENAGDAEKAKKYQAELGNRASLIKAIATTHYK